MTTAAELLLDLADTLREWNDGDDPVESIDVNSIPMGWIIVTFESGKWFSITVDDGDEIEKDCQAILDRTLDRLEATL